MRPSRAGCRSRPGRPLRVLVVEDERKVAEALRQGLEGEGYDVVVETSGEAAFFRLTTDRFDLILLDLRLPGRDGIEILSAVAAARAADAGGRPDRA